MGAGAKRKSSVVVGAAEAAPSTASALDDFKAHVAKRQQGLSALLASNQPNANGGAASTPSEPIVGKDVAKLNAELERLKAKHDALRSLRETEPERLHTAAISSAADASKAADGVIQKLRAEKQKLLEDMTELSAAVGSMEGVVAERDALLVEKAALKEELAKALRAAAASKPAADQQQPPAAPTAAAEASADVQLCLRTYEMLTGLTLRAVTTSDGEPAVLCRGKQRGGHEGDGLVFSLFAEPGQSDGSAEVEFDLHANTLRGVAPEALPPFLRATPPTEEGGGEEDGGTSISFAAADGAAFFAKIALALCTPPAASS